ELLTTEHTYLEHLTLAKQMFMDPLIKAATQSTPTVSLRHIDAIFKLMPALVALSTHLTHKLRATMEVDTVANVLCGLEKELEVYVLYAVRYPKLQKCLSKISTTSVFRQLTRESLGNKQMNRMVLADYLIAPIQRITRYCLLLR
ncbi:Dbl homology domain-containing protein, partial [Spinellus fusiger]